MKDAEKPNNLGIWTNIKPGVVVDIDGEQWQVLTRLNFSSEMMNVQDGRLKVWQQEELEEQGAYVVEGAATLHDRLSQYGVVVRERDEWKDQLSKERKAYNALLNQTDEICAAVGVTSGETSLDMVREAAKRVGRLESERDEWKGLVTEIREAFGVTDEREHIYLVGEVHKLKEGQSDQVIKLQEHIKTRDEHWNKICEAVGLPGQGRTDEEKVTEEIEAMVKALDHHAGYYDVLSEDIKRLAEIADAVEDLCPEDTEPEDFADQWRWTEELVGILRNALGRHRDVMRQVAHIAGIQRVTYSCTDSEYEVCDYDDMLKLLRTLKENEQGDHTSFTRKVLAIFDEHPDNKQLVLDRINGLKSKATSQDSQIKQMDEALEQSLMEIAQQAGVIAELRDELKRAQNSIDDLMYDAANLNGQKEAYERALQIVGGAR